MMHMADMVGCCWLGRYQYAKKVEKSVLRIWSRSVCLEGLQGRWGWHCGGKLDINVFTYPQI